MGPVGLVVGRGNVETWWTTKDQPISTFSSSSPPSSFPSSIPLIPVDQFGGMFKMTKKEGGDDHHNHFQPWLHLWIDFNNVHSLRRLPSNRFSCIVFDWSTFRYMRPLDFDVTNEWRRILVAKTIPAAAAAAAFTVDLHQHACKIPPSSCVVFEAQIASISLHSNNFGCDEDGIRFLDDNYSHVSFPIQLAHKVLNELLSTSCLSSSSATVAASVPSLSLSPFTSPPLLKKRTIVPATPNRFDKLSELERAAVMHLERPGGLIEQKWREWSDSNGFIMEVTRDAKRYPIQTRYLIPFYITFSL